MALLGEAMLYLHSYSILAQPSPFECAGCAIARIKSGGSVSESFRSRGGYESNRLEEGDTEA